MTVVMITGCAGLIGSRLADWIHENHPTVEIVGIDDLSGGYLENVNNAVHFYKYDCTSNALEKIFDEWQPDIVWHLAAYASEGLSPFMRKFNYTNNLVAAANIINNCIKHKTKRLVFTSSMAVYGFGATPDSKYDKSFVPFYEDEIMPAPIDPYGIAKLACELDIKVAGDQHGLDWCIIRPHNVYGRNQNLWDTYRNVIGIWMYKILHNEDISIYGDGEQRRSFSYIDDILECLCMAGTSKRCSKQIINLGSPESESCTINEMAQTLKEVVGAPEYPVIHLPPRHEVRIAIPSARKSYEYLGFQHKTSLREGVARMWEWAKQQPNRERFVWPSYELDVGLYPYWQQSNLKESNNVHC